MLVTETKSLLLLSRHGGNCHAFVLVWTFAAVVIIVVVAVASCQMVVVVVVVIHQVVVVAIDACWWQYVEWRWW